MAEKEKLSWTPINVATLPKWMQDKMAEQKAAQAVAAKLAKEITEAFQAQAAAKGKVPANTTMLISLRYDPSYAFISNDKLKARKGKKAAETFDFDEAPAAPSGKKGGK